MKIVASIPARFNASRFPGKLMQILGNKSVIRHVYDNVVVSGLFDSVFVATDSTIIYEEIISNGGVAFMSKKEHESGSDRIAEVVANMDVDIVVNIQGDEPFIQKEALEKLVFAFKNPTTLVASLMRKITRAESLKPSAVKVVVDKNNNALYFSRHPIPYQRNESVEPFLHVGIYGYKKEILLAFSGWKKSILEQAESLEQLRFLENGIKINMVETDYISVAIDTPEDLAFAQQLLNLGFDGKTK